MNTAVAVLMPRTGLDDDGGASGRRSEAGSVVHHRVQTMRWRTHALASGRRAHWLFERSLELPSHH
jgi:hypothetical protein